MRICWCSLAGTEACKHCKEMLIWTDISKEGSIDYKDFTDYKSFKDTWEIPSFMLKENSNES